MGEKKKTAPQADKRALYRKYRSKSLDEVIGQEHITDTLKSALKNNKVSHAYLFTGPRGVGKTSIARILAHEVNKLPYGDDKTHLDIIEIDAASNRRIDDIRDLREKVNLAPVNGEYKVYIIDEVHMLTSESFNALLKTLEEPPAHVIFILATTEVHKLPATIISRTQRHTFKAVSIEKVTKHLASIAKQEGIEIDEAALKLLAEHGEGSFRDSISLLDQASHLPQPVTAKTIENLLGIAPSTALANLLEFIEKGETKELLAKLESLIEGGIAPTSLARQLTKVIRDSQPSLANTQLMKELLTVSSSIQPKLQLEIVLLERCLKNSGAEKIMPKAKVEEPGSNSATPQTSPPEPELKKNSKTQPEAPALNVETVELHQDLEQAWPNILSSVKELNGSLYSVMRLAHPELNDRTLLLQFRFPFHQKRASEAKNIALITSLVEKHMGLQVVIEVVINAELSTHKNTPKPAAHPAHASLIASVQDIMGGGEVVNA